MFLVLERVLTMGLEEGVGEVYVGGYWQVEGMETLFCKDYSRECRVSVGDRVGLVTFSRYFFYPSTS